MRKLFVFLLWNFLSGSLLVSAAPSATTLAEQNLYAGPERGQAVVGYLSAGEALTLEGRDQTGLWLLVNLVNGLRGWTVTTAADLADDVNLYDLPVSSDIIAAETPAYTPAPLSDKEDILAAINRLRQTPILYNIDTQAVTDIFAHGQILGNRADVFTTVGDSNTTSGDFLRPMGMPNQCDLGSFSYLQETIAYFSTALPNSSKNSFAHTSTAAQNGLSSSAALDPMWSETGCEPNENPVMCELRRFKPSVAIINLGLMDVRYDTPPDMFRSNIETLVQQSIDQGVIPVLTNIIVLPDQQTLSFETAIQYDNILLDVADSYDIPLLNLWRAVQSIPDYGIGPDRTHMRHVVGSFCDFTGAEQRVGGTLRNLLTLIVLDELRRQWVVE